jgi:hypothetical protein
VFCAVQTITYNLFSICYIFLYCSECSEILETDNSTLSCTNVTGMIVCTHTCNDGYSFDHDVKQEYKCGNETYYYWDFQTDDNPYGRLPFCTGKHIN